MASCVNCGRSGIFLGVNKYKICNICIPSINLELNSRGRVIAESMNLIVKSASIDTRLSRCAVILENAQALLRYEKMGIPFQMPPSALLNTYKSMPSVIVSEGILSEAHKVDEKIKLASSLKPKINLLAKLVLFIDSNKGKAPSDELVHRIERQTREALHALNLQVYIEEAEKAELKNNKKKALDQYYEALYFLQHDDVDDRLQEKSITKIERKIAELSGKDSKIIDVVAE